MTQSILPLSLDYTDKDFASLRLRLFALISSVFPQWTDENVANFGNILLELFCFTGDVLTFYQDNQAREARLATATQRKNVVALAQMLGYAPRSAQAATALETFTLLTPATGQVTLPAGTVVLTANVTAPLPFQTLTDVVFAPGSPAGATQTATVENSTNVVDTFTSNGQPNQTFALTQTPFIDGSVSVVATDGTYAQGTASQWIAGGGLRIFLVQVDQKNRATLVFGNGVNGAIPSGNLTVSYKVGGGAAGSVTANTINRLQGTFTDALGNPVNLSATNLSNATPGVDRDTIAQIKLLAPVVGRVNQRSVGKDDFETNALRVSGVARALLTTSNEDPAVEENTGVLYVVPVGGGNASAALLTVLNAQFGITPSSTIAPNAPTTTFRLSVTTAVYFAINVFVRAFAAKGVAKAQMALNLRTALATYFQVSLPDGTPNPNIDFGANLGDLPNTGLFPLAPLFAALEQTAGVRKLGGAPSDFLLNGGHGDVSIAPRQFPVLGTVTIVDGDTGASL